MKQPKQIVKRVIDLAIIFDGRDTHWAGNTQWLGTVMLTLFLTHIEQADKKRTTAHERLSKMVMQYYTFRV